MTKLKSGLVVACLAGAALAWAALPLALSRSHLDMLNFAAILGVGGLGVGLLLGQCGIVNLGQAAFYGCGAYASAYCTTILGWPPVAGVALGAATSAALAAAIGYPILRLSGFFLALATLAVGSIVGVLFFEWDWLTGGTLGIGGIPKFGLFGFSLDTPERYHYFVWPVLALALWLSHNLVNGRPGLAMRAMRDAAPAAEVMAIDMHRLKTTVFVLCAVLGSLAGSLFAHYVSFVSVQSFTIERSILFLLVPVIAGAHSVPGVTLGALFVALAPELLSGLGDFHQVLFGLLLVLVVTLVPGGLVGILERLWRRTMDVAPAPQAGSAVVLPATTPRQAPGALRMDPPRTEGPEHAPPDAGRKPLLAMQAIAHSFGGLQVLRNVEVEIPAGRIVGLIGPNGSGKTTCFNIASGFLRPRAGRVLLDGVDITAHSVQERSRAGLVRTFQTPKVFDHMTVRENLMVGEYKSTRAGVLRSMVGAPGARAEIVAMRARAEQCAERFGLSKLLSTEAGLLPAGQRRIVELARACIGGPRILLLDEPSSGLNSEEIETLRNWIVTLNREGLTVFLVSHDMGLMTVCDVTHVLYFGELIASGHLADVQANPRVREAYLGV